MASNYLKRKVEERDKIIKRKEEAKKSSSVKSGGAETEMSSGRASSFLQKRAAERSAATERQSYKSATFRQASNIPLKAQDGTDFGKISYDAYAAIIKNNIDNYTPKNEQEKKAISDFKTYADKQARITSNPVYAKYNIDPLEFDRKDLEEWAEKR
ncbi:MAG: hypothetical protein E7408_03285, partial [Ruminococcaceae bacterium]|nr:hypothetical protein [Oscillospiraceae bacterium]